jgi:peptidyl-tRNA hydrolase, PTH1 family
MSSASEKSIQLIVGLGNPGAEYHDTRHNAGAWFVNHVVQTFNLSLRNESKFYGQCAEWQHASGVCRLLLPNTFMNHSGQPVKALSHFYKIPTHAILVAHDELDLLPGDVRLKHGGGHAGHNGLRDIIHQLGSSDFTRLRIGIGHPGHRDHVHDHVLSNPSKHDKQRILHALTETTFTLDLILAGELQKAMKQLHTKDLSL